MERFSFHIHANNSPTSIEFIEKKYKLNEGEVMIGKEDDFPEKKNINSTVKWLDGWAVAEGEIISVAGALGLGNDINIAALIDSFFPVLSEGDNRPDRGITCEVEFFHFVNHLSETNTDPPAPYHLAVTANRVIRFNIMKTVTDSDGSAFYANNATITTISQQGHWVLYDSVQKLFDKVDSHGVLNMASIGVSLSVVGGVLFLSITNNLRAYFDANPQYVLSTKYKLRMYNHAFPSVEIATEYTQDKEKK